MDRRELLRVMVLPIVPRPPVSPENGPHPILSSVEAVIARARHVAVHRDRIEEVAGWMAYEALPWPDFRSPLIPQGNHADTMDFIFLTSTINFAFTDFDQHVIFRTVYEGREYSDSDAMMACLKRTYEEGTPILTGRFLKNVTRKDLSSIFAGNIEMPMLDERLAIFHGVGEVLESGYQGRFHRFIGASAHRLYDSGGGGLLQRLVSTFPSFRDEGSHRGKPVRFDKRAQLLLWQLHARFRDDGFFALEDPESLTIFADYIVPVALRLLGITGYSTELENKIRERRVIPKDSEEEVEIRAASIWACHLLTVAINAKRPSKLQVIDPIVDGRLWTHYHETHWPHHLTVTTAY